MNNLNKFAICVIVCSGITFAFPQNWPSSSNSKQGNNWEGKSRQDAGKGFGGDSDSETLPSTILEQHEVNIL